MVLNGSGQVHMSHFPSRDANVALLAISEPPTTSYQALHLIIID